MFYLLVETKIPSLGGDPIKQEEPQKSLVDTWTQSSDAAGTRVTDPCPGDLRGSHGPQQEEVLGTLRLWEPLPQAEALVPAVCNF